MGQINTKLIKQLVHKKPSVFVETGTFKGGIPQMMLEDKSFNDWNKIYTIELNLEMCKIASKRYSLYESGKSFDRNTNEKDESFKDRKEFFDGKLVLICGNSAEKLKEVLNEVDEPCAFWMDAHGGSKDGYMSGDEDCPLLSELKVIGSFDIDNHFIAIDDVDMFGITQFNGEEVACDYTEITLDKVKSLLYEINEKYKIDVMSPLGQQMLVARLGEIIEIDSSDSWWD